MFREMRRKNQALSEIESIELLKQGTSGVLALLGDDDYPYAVPISYVYDDSKIYFHCAKTGHKIDALKKNPKVSFCVINQDNIVPEEYTTYYKSVIAFGKIRIVEEKETFLEAIEKLAFKYHPTDSVTHRTETIDKAINNFYMLELQIEHLTGKIAKELIKH